jgi:carbon-monoxide dehydrogenase medium subunit
MSNERFNRLGVSEKLSLPLFRPEEFFNSKDKAEILSKLKSEGKHGRIIAGGTGFYELAKRGYIPEVKTIVSIMDLGLSYIKSDQDHLIIGATTTLQELLDSNVGHYAGLEAIEDALKEIRPVQVRNVATVGGELCISVPIVDLPTALLACNASIQIISENGESVMKLEDFYVDAFLTKLRYGELVKEVIVPKHDRRPPSSKISSAFVKFGRTAYDFNLINCAVSLESDQSSKKIKSIRIFLGGIKRIPIQSLEVEKKLVGRVPNEKIVQDAVESGFSKTNLLPSVHGSSEYKHAMLPVVVRDCVMKAYERNNANGLNL